MGKLQIISLSIIAILIPGCASPKMYDKEYRTNRLREIYPPGVTTRADIHKNIQFKPDLLERRPDKGWGNFANTHLAKKLQLLEEQNSKQIILVERYMLPDARSSFDFLSLCKIWFYYDAQDKVVDVEWEYQSD